MKNVENSVMRVKATMEIEGFKINKNDIKRLIMIGENKLNGDKLIEKYIRRVNKLSGVK